MEFVVWIYKTSEKLRKIVLSVLLSYLAGISIEYISNSSSLAEVLLNFIDFSKVSVILLWAGVVITGAIWIFNIVFDRIRISNKVEVKFKRIMTEHTSEVLNKSEIGTYSWGYNKNLCVPKNPGGWKPEDVYIDLRNSNIDSEYRFPVNNTILNGYDNESYQQYCKSSSKIDTIRQRGDDKDRYAVQHVEKSMKGNKVEIRLQKTSWSQLQFSWDYLRRIDSNSETVIHLNREAEIDEIFEKALNHNEELLINSFCLHLILVSKNGKAILSRISRVKSNDYPSTWAATIGEQIEIFDFLNEDTGEVYSDFVVRWVKRALKEEFGIDENSFTELGVSELEEYVDMNSLKVLSVDFEGDIYNVALTCVLKLKIDASELKSIKEIQIDDNENTNEFLECSESDVRKILLGYPGNKKQYHPSAYLRLLMYHLWSCKQLATLSEFVKDSKKTTPIKCAKDDNIW